MKDYTQLCGKLRRAFPCENRPDGCYSCEAGGKCRTQLVHKGVDAIEELIRLHQLDLSELVRLRRQIQALLEEKEARA